MLIVQELRMGCVLNKKFNANYYKVAANRVSCATTSITLHVIFS